MKIDIRKQYPFVLEDIQANFKNNLLYRCSERKSIAIKSDVWEIIKYIDGITSFSSIYEELIRHYQINEDSFYLFMDELKERRIISFSEEAIFRPIVSVNYSFPEVVSLVLTDRCNLKCSYCYGNYEPHGNSFLSIEKTKDLIAQLKDIGVRVLELTGGEPLVHPGFKEILEFACESFEYISIMTNGSLFRKEFYDIVSKHNKKIGIRISVDGMTSTTNDLIRQVKGTKNRTFKAIEKLINLGVNVGVTYMMLYENRWELEEFCAYMKKLGLKTIMISAPEDIGRGNSQTFPDGKMISDRTSECYQEMVNIYTNVSRKYSDIMRFTNDKQTKSNLHLLPNCGAGWKNVSIFYNGDVQACQLVTDTIKIGNFFHQSIRSIFIDNEVVDFFSTIRFSPEKAKACLKCDSVSFCGKCIIKIMIVNKRRIDNGQAICNTAINNKITENIINKYLNNAN
ncbi:MAG: radical SAM protein [Bacteroidales bacterium]|jgi:radical SAM protein with 4Fe4S-binding SPASM domain|nr:radical SAM protein [Bacteroidales bacterium]